jgi:hypothetical protein
MNPPEKKIWFPAKRYGWGWGPPTCWQALLTLLLIGICYLKGEKPRWRWGKD